MQNTLLPFQFYWILNTSDALLLGFRWISVRRFQDFQWERELYRYRDCPRKASTYRYREIYICGRFAALLELEHCGLFETFIIGNYRDGVGY